MCVPVCIQQVEDFIRDAEEALRGAEERNAAFASRQVGAFLAIGQGQRRGSGRRKQQQEQPAEEAEEQQQQQQQDRKGRKGRKAGAPRRGAAAELNGSGGGNGNGVASHEHHPEVEVGEQEGDEGSRDELRAEVEAVRRQLEAVAAAAAAAAENGGATAAAAAVGQPREVTRVLQGGRRLTLQVGGGQQRSDVGFCVGYCADADAIAGTPPGSVFLVQGALRGHAGWGFVQLSVRLSD